MSQQDCDLRDGIKSNDVQLVKTSLKSGADVNHPLPGYKYNALFLAIDLQHQEIVEHLIENGASIDYEDETFNCQTPLTYAIHKNSLSIVKLLIAKGANVNKVHLDGDTPLSRAVRLNKLRIIEYLLQKGADVDQVGWKEKTPLLWAVTKNNLAAAQILISYGADVKKPDSSGTTALALAKRAKNSEIIDYLTSYKMRQNRGDSKMLVMKAVLDEVSVCSSETSINKLDTEGITPLLKAVEMGKVDAVQYLLTLGADACRCGNDGTTPLLLAVQKKDIDIIRLLLENGGEHTIHTAFLEAISIGDPEIVALLLESGALVNIVYKNGRTPLSRAIEENSLDIIKLLVGHGANINMPDAHENLPITLAVQKNNLNIVKYLIDNSTPPPSLLEHCPFLVKYIEENNFEMVEILVNLGVKINVVFECGNSPLTKAVQTDNFKMVKYLVDKGADVNLSTADGRVPLALAAANRNLRIVKFLISVKADLDKAKGEIESYAKQNEDFAIFLDVLRGKYRKWESDTSLQPSDGWSRTSKDTI